MDRSKYNPKTLRKLDDILSCVIDFTIKDLTKWAILIDKSPVDEYLESVKRDTVRTSLMDLGFHYITTGYFKKEYYGGDTFMCTLGIWMCHTKQYATSEGIHIINIDDFLKLLNLLLTKCNANTNNNNSIDEPKGKTTVELITEYFKMRSNK